MSDERRLVMGTTTRPEKLQQAILFFLNRFGSLDERHLTYLLYQADFDHMEKHRTSITGLHYLKGRQPDVDAWWGDTE